MVHFAVGDGPHWRPATLADKPYSLEYTVGHVDIDPEESPPTTVDDDTVVLVSSSVSDPYYDLSLVGQTDGVTIEVLDATGSLVGNRLSRVSDGMCRVIARHPLLSQGLVLDMTRLVDHEYEVLDGFEPGSLAHEIVDQMTTLIGDKTASAKPVYSAQNHTDGIYVRDSSCWAASLDLTAVSPWNSLGGSTRAGTAISPRHTMHAAHYPVTIGTVLRFVAAGNVVVSRTVEDVTSIGSDMQIALLDTALPGTITPVKFLPADLYDYLPSLVRRVLPVLAFDYQEQALVKTTAATDFLASSFMLFANALEQPFIRMTEPIIGGDSGNPIFFVVDGEACLLSHWSASTTGPAYHKLLSTIGSAMTSLGGGYSPQTVNLSAFTNYGA